MTVQTEHSSQEFIGNGVTTDFSFNFPLFEKEDAVLVVIDKDGGISILTLDVDYSIPGSRFNNGGTAILNEPLAGDGIAENSSTLIVSRDIDATQEWNVRNQGSFNPVALEAVLDKLTMLNQECLKFGPESERSVEIGRIEEKKLLLVESGKLISSTSSVEDLENATNAANEAADNANNAAQNAEKVLINLPSGQWAAGITFNSANEFMNFNGVGYTPLPTTTFPYVTQGNDPTQAPDNAFVQPFSNVNSSNISTYTDLVYKASGGNSAVDNMLAGIPREASLDDVVSTGNTEWKRISVSVPTVIGDFEHQNEINFKDFGAVGGALLPDNTLNPSAVDDTAKFVEGLAARKNIQSIDLHDSYLLNLDIYDPINGNNNTIFGQQTLNTDQTSDVWKFNEHINVNFRNDDTGTLVSYPVGDIVAGRHCFIGSSFRDAEVGVYKPAGNIGDRYRDCSFIGLDIGYKAVGVADQHVGAMEMDGCHFWFQRIAAVFMDNSAGTAIAPTAGIVFNNCIFENNDGFSLYLKGKNGGNQLGETPFNRIEFNGAWFEGDLSSKPLVNIDGQLRQPRHIQCVDMADTTFKNSYIWDMNIINSTVFLDDCRVDREFTGSITIDIDDDSMVYVKGLSTSTFAGFSCDPRFFVSSWKQCNNANNSESVLVRMPDCNRYSKRELLNLQSKTFATSYTMAGSQNFVPVVVNDGILSDTCCEYIVPIGQNLQTPVADRFDPEYADQDTWVVFTVSMKIVAGSFQSGGMRGGFEIGSLQALPKGSANNKGQWVTVRGYKKVIAGTTGWAGLFFNSNGTEPLKLRLADYSCGLYESEEEAIAAVNNGVCVIS